jgi:ferredoxin
MKSKTITQGGLAALVTELVAGNTRVVAPAPVGPDRNNIAYRDIKSLEEAAFNKTLPMRSLKEYFLPPTEPLLRYRQTKQDVALEEISGTIPPTIVLGARPCDTAAIEILDKVMNWDYRDTPWFRRREATTIINLACDTIDNSCFCSAVGLGPDSGRGADLLLVPADGGYHVEILSEKGERFAASHSGHFSDDDNSARADAFKKTARAKVESNLIANPKDIEGWLRNNFDEAYWNDLALRCHGCGACASVCPTCHCFDIVDESEGISTGVRRRNWDTCQTSKFTIHASGHNPRNDQNARIRQRVMHKFYIYPDRFGEVLCTGCGRCARVCPGGMDLPEILRQLGRKSENAKPRDAV